MILAALLLALQDVPPTPTPPGPGRTITVTATRIGRDVLDVPRLVTVIDDRRLVRRNPFSVLDAADDQPGVWIEKRTTTTSDIVLRGLSGSNILALIDGNTLSTLWGEGGFAGDDLYGKVDADSVATIDIVHGPASVLYGSNALGGVVNFRTRSCPLAYPEEGLAWGSRTRLGYGSAATEYRFREEVYAAEPRGRVLVGVSRREAHDVEGGRGVGTQSPTGGREITFDAKAEVRTTERSLLTLGAQHIERDKVRRFYRPTEENDNERLGLAATWETRASGPLWDEAELRLYFQDKEDRRTWNSTGATGWARWRTIAGGARCSRSLGDHFLTCGLAAERVDGESPDDEQFTRELPGVGLRKDAPDSIWTTTGIYVQDEWEAGPALRAIASARFDRFHFETNPDQHYVPPGSWNPELDDISEVRTALTGGVGVVWSLQEELRLYASGYRGYRLWPPRFGATKQGYGVLVPSGLLPPVTGDTAEVGAKGELDAASFSAAFYRTWFRNWQVIEPGSFEGSTWYDWDGDSIQDADETVYVTRSVGNAYVYGVEIRWDLRLHKVWDQAPDGLSFRGGFAWNLGKNRWNDEPVRHTIPANALLSLRWEDPAPASGSWVEATAHVVRRFARVPSDRLANDPGYRSDPQNMSSPLLRPYGLPGYTVFSLRGGVRFGERAEFTLAVENLTDKKYRRAHSRWDEPGANVLLGMTVKLEKKP